MTTRFRTSFTHREGFDDAIVVQARIVNVNLSNWTVDVITSFDRKRFFEIQVSSPYLHYSNGEGIYVVPEVGALCMVAIPSDSSPPFVLAFVMPHTFVNAGTVPQQQGAPQQFATDASYDGGRKSPKPGDIVLRTRDGNFVQLHRGGVLSIGANELSQRIYIPMTNLITDISGNYEHHNSSGSIRWGLQDGPSKEHIPGEYMHTFRVSADDKFADIRVLVGHVRRPVPEPSDGDQEDLDQLSIANDQEDVPIIYEVVVSKSGFEAGTGELADTSVSKNAVLRFLFDRNGGTFLRCKGSLLISSKKKLRLKSSEEMEMEAKAFFVKAVDGAEIDGGKYTHIKGKLVRLGAGGSPVARQGDVVTVVMPPGTIPFTGVVGAGPAAGSAVTGFITGGQAVGVISSGNPAVLA